MTCLNEIRKATLRAKRFLLWLVAGEVRPVVLVALVFTVYMMLQAFGFAEWSSSPKIVQIVATLLIFGLFLGVILVTDIREPKAGTATRKRVMAGVASCSAIAIVFDAPWEGVALAAGVGAVLGFFGMSWAQHV